MLPTQNKSFATQRPLLIVDKKGIIGKILATKLSEHFLTVLVTPTYSKGEANIIHIPFAKKVPKIPDNYYSYIFLIDDGEILSTSMQSFIKKANADQSRLILIEGVRHSNSKSIDETRYYRNANVFFYGDLFSEDQVLGNFSKELLETKDKKQYQIEGEGLDKYYPIFIDDFVNELINQVFVKNNPSKFINVFPSSAITKLGISRIIQSIDPEIKTDFIKKKKETADIKAFDGDYVLPQIYDLKSRIKKVLEYELPEDFAQEESLSEEIEDKNYLKTGFIFSAIFILFFLLLPLITTVVYAGLGLYEIGNLRNDLDRGSLKNASVSAKNSKTFFDFAQKTIVPLRTEANLIGKSSLVDKLSDNINLGDSISQASLDLIFGAEKIQNVVIGNTLNASDDFDSSMALVRGAITSFRNIQAQSQNFPQISKKLSDISPVIDLLSNISPNLNQILGFDGEKKYLILFQNNMELRPGGGFIGSYAILDIKNAMVQNFKIYNVYDADGQLKGHVDPPFPIRKYLNQPDLYLRDSNFSPEFVNNASSAAFLLNLETGEKVDAVASVDLDFVRGILSATGPVRVSDYNLTVDSGNLFQVAEEKSQKDSFSGSTQKQDFLSALLKSIQTKLGQDNISYLALSKAISNALAQKHILLASNNPIIQENFSVNDWSSEIPDASSSADNQFDDYLGIVDANLGINKVNYFISRTISKAQMIDDQGSLSSTVSVVYKNDSPHDVYKNYVRFILPGSISINQISFDNVAQNIFPDETNPEIYESKAYKAPGGLGIDNYSYKGKTIVGFLTEIPPNSSKTISITYDLNQTINLGDDFSYSLSFYKQPGVEQAPFNKLSHPLIGRILPEGNLLSHGGLSFISLCIFAFTVPFVLGLDDFAGYIPLFSIVNVVSFSIGVFLAHMLLTTSLFISPKRTVQIVEKPIIIILGSTAFILIALYGFIEVIKMIL